MSRRRRRKIPTELREADITDLSHDGRGVAHIVDLAKDERDVVICGDWNIAHKKIDIKNWRGNQKNSGFLSKERAADY